MADDFRKTNANGQGYQPMLYKVYSATYVQQGEVIQLDVTFESGEERSFRYVFEKRIKAGVLLYALLMLAVFSLILQFYLKRQFVESQLVQVTKQEATAYMMAQMVSEQVKTEYQQEIQLKKVSQIKK